MMLKYWCRLYCNQTEAERALEPAVAALGQVYRTQHPFWGHRAIVDFVLLKLRVIIEVDDDSHSRAAKKKADAERTAKQNAAGWKVFRCWNEEAIADPRGTVARLMREAGLEHLIKDKP